VLSLEAIALLILSEEDNPAFSTPSCALSFVFYRPPVLGAFERGSQISSSQIDILIEPERRDWRSCAMKRERAAPMLLVFAATSLLAADYKVYS
jgi:hypothetical protein